MHGMEFGMREPPATALSRRHRRSPRSLLLEEMQHPQAFPLLLATPRSRRQHLLHPELLVSWAARRGEGTQGMCPKSHLVPAPSPALRNKTCAATLRWARRPAIDPRIAKCTSSRTPRPGWRHAGGTRSTGPPTTPFTSTRLVSAPGTWLAASTSTRNSQTTQNRLIFPVKLDPLPSGMSFSKTGGQLRVRVPQPQCHGMEQPPQREARFWRVGDSSWTQVTCETVMVTGEDDSVTCALGVNGTFVVQLRHKPQHWSSYWSDWSSNISVPEEILASPVLSHQLGKLGRDGQRVLRLSWQVQWRPWGPSRVSATISCPESPPFPPQPVLKEQRNVTYKLDVRMLACGCAESDEKDTVLGWEVTEHNLTLSGAEYEILLTAVNTAGPGPAQQLRVPAEQRADLSFKEISVAGSTVTVQWEAPVAGSTFCFEQQTPPEPPKQGVCIRQEFPANSIHVERGRERPKPPAVPPPGVRGSNQHPRFLLRIAGSAGLSPPRRARLGREAGLGHLRPVAPLRQQRCVWELCIRTWFHSRRGVPEIIPRFFAHRLAGRAHQHQHRRRRRCPPVETVPTSRLSRRAGQVPHLPRGRGGQRDLQRSGCHGIKLHPPKPPAWHSPQGGCLGGDRGQRGDLQSLVALPDQGAGSPGSSVERQPEVPGHPAWSPRRSCHLLPEQKEGSPPPLPTSSQARGHQSHPVLCRRDEPGPAPDRPPGALGEVQPSRAAADGAGSQRGDG
ncbi:interleukin-12 receptor subunit beta-1 isoform X1 [Corvus cornix cornix]|uniref:interleukin-12 receptor subunit beta-1 isoform X1 n=1 Tax=Corvus cornix cornix TaxID=932674 RepID=UPI00194F2F5C|nr:interleukin-12 receptor subunit beta-1 isoform X1 [Corvus cornix cornix]